MTDTDRLAAIRERAQPNFDWMRLVPPYFVKGSVSVQEVMASRMAQDIPWLLARIEELEAVLQAERKRHRRRTAQWPDKFNDCHACPPGIGWPCPTSQDLDAALGAPRV